MSYSRCSVTALVLVSTSLVLQLQALRDTALDTLLAPTTEQASSATGKTAKLTVGTFNVLSQMKCVRGPTGFPIMTRDAFNQHQPSLTDQDKAHKYTQSSAPNTWIQGMLQDLMVTEDGPTIDLLVLQEIDFPMFDGMLKFVEDNEGFDWAALEETDKTTAQNAQSEMRQAYENKQIASFKVDDHPYIVFRTSTVNSVKCEPTEGYEGAGICDFKVAGSDATYKGLFMHASSVGISKKFTFDQIKDEKYDLIVGDLNAHQPDIVAGNANTKLTILQHEDDASTMIRHVYKLRKVSQCAQNTKNYLAVKRKICDSTDANFAKNLDATTGMPTQESGLCPDAWDKPLTCKVLKEQCGCKDGPWSLQGDYVCDQTTMEKQLSKDCKYGSKVCSAMSESPTSKKEADELKESNFKDEVASGDINMGIFSKYLGYGALDAKLEEPKYSPSDPAYVEFESGQEDWILVAPNHVESENAPVAKVYNFKEVNAAKEKLEKAGSGLPSQLLPSDHLPVYATVQLKEPAAGEKSSSVFSPLVGLWNSLLRACNLA